MKIIANYLPQFHRIPENDKWWGEGFTDWQSAKNAEPLFEGHYEPRIPLADNYYDLSKVENIRWQTELAKKYGIYGFGIYHYWFNSDVKLLEKPSELIRDNKDIDIHYLFIWDNSSWGRTWTNEKFAVDWVEQTKKQGNAGNGILAKLEYGDEKDWKIHFDYLNTFFEDPRYIKIDGRPVFIIFNQHNKPEILKRMVNCWDQLARGAGYAGIKIIGKKNYRNINISDYQVCYEPAQSALQPDEIFLKILLKIKAKIYHDKRPFFFDYDRVWKRSIKKARRSGKEPWFYSGFVSFDDSPRRGINARIVLNESPKKFERYFTELLKISKRQGKEYVFLTAWNEWGEGAYLEPDQKNRYAYLEAVRNSLKSCRDI